MIPTLYELAQAALDEAYKLRCESLLQDAFENIPTPIQQNGSLQKIKKKRKHITSDSCTTYTQAIRQCF